MALPVIKATKFNYGAYAQPKQVKFKDPNAGIVAGIASVGRQVAQKIEENKLQEQKNNITIAKNNSEYKYAATQVQNQFGDKVDKYVQGLVDRFADNEKFRVSNPDNLEQYLDTKNQLNGLLQQLLALKQKGVSLKSTFKNLDVNNLTGSSLDNYHKADALINEHFELSDKDGELFISLTTTDLSKAKPSSFTRGIAATPDFSNVFTKQEAVSNYMLDENYFKVDTKWDAKSDALIADSIKIVAADNNNIKLDRRKLMNKPGYEGTFLTSNIAKDYVNQKALIKDHQISKNIDLIIQQDGKKIYEDEIAGAVGGYDPNNVEQNKQLKEYLINKIVETGFSTDVQVDTQKIPEPKKEPEYTGIVTSITDRFDRFRIFDPNNRSEIIYNNNEILEDVKNNPTAYNITELSKPTLNNFMNIDQFYTLHVVEAKERLGMLNSLSKEEQKAYKDYDSEKQVFENIIKFYEDNTVENKEGGRRVPKNSNAIVNANSVNAQGQIFPASPVLVNNFTNLLLQLTISKDPMVIDKIFKSASDIGRALVYAKYKPGMSYEDYKEATYKLTEKRTEGVGEFIFDESVDELIKQQYDSLKNK
jgi:hypothetical protein